MKRRTDTNGRRRPAVSFVIPVYNAALYLDQCLCSILAQNHDLEVVAVDDGSSDGSDKILADFAASFPECLRVASQRRAGPGPARNLGFSLSSGSFVWFVDADDMLPRGVIGPVLDRARVSGAEALCFGWREFPPHWRRPPNAARNMPPPRRISFEEAILSFGPVPWAKIWRRELLERATVRFPAVFCEDNVETPRLLLAARSVAAVDSQYYCCRRGHSSVSGVGGVSKSAAEGLDALFAAFDEMAALQDPRYRDVLDWAAAKTAAYMEKIALAALQERRGDPACAASFLSKARMRLGDLLARSEVCRDAMRRVAFQNTRLALRRRSLPLSIASSLHSLVSRQASKPKPDPRFFRPGNPLEHLRSDMERCIKAQEPFPPEIESVRITAGSDPSALISTIDSVLAQNAERLVINVLDDGSGGYGTELAVARYGPLVRFKRSMGEDPVFRDQSPPATCREEGVLALAAGDLLVPGRVMRVVPSPHRRLRGRGV